MGVDLKKMKKAYDSQKRGGEFLAFDPGDTKVYIHEPCRPDDEYEPTAGLNYIALTVHYSVGKNNSMVVCLSESRNKILTHPFIKGLLKKKKARLDGTCPVCEDIESGALDDDKADECRPQQRFLWGVTPMEYRSSKSDDWRQLARKPTVALVGKSVTDGIMESFVEAGDAGEDLSNPERAIYLLVGRTGKTKNDTKYKVSSDLQTFKQPVKLGKELRGGLKEAMKEDGDCDLFRVVANMLKSPGDIQALITGVKTDNTDTDDDGEAELDERKSKSKSDDDEELPVPKKAAKAEDESGGEDDDEPAPKKAKVKAEDDEDDGLDALDEELDRIAKNKSKKAKA